MRVPAWTRVVRRASAGVVPEKPQRLSPTSTSIWHVLHGSLHHDADDAFWAAGAYDPKLLDPAKRKLPIFKQKP